MYLDNDKWLTQRKYLWSCSVKSCALVNLPVTEITTNRSIIGMMVTRSLIVKFPAGWTWSDRRVPEFNRTRSAPVDARITSHTQLPRFVSPVRTLSNRPSRGTKNEPRTSSIFPSITPGKNMTKCKCRNAKPYLPKYKKKTLHIRCPLSHSQCSIFRKIPIHNVFKLCAIRRQLLNFQIIN